MTAGGVELRDGVKRPTLRLVGGTCDLVREKQKQIWTPG